MANLWTLAVLLTCLFAVSDGGVTSWWSLGITNCAVSDSCNSCDELRGENILTDTQVKKCSDDSQGVRAIASGIRTAIIECHNQFKDRKWTCSALTSEGSENLFGSFVSEKRTRETAVLYAFLVAGATKKLAEFCQIGKIRECECVIKVTQGRDDQNNIIFNKCDENATWALNYIQNFTTSPYQDLSINDTGALIDMHNIEVGKQIMNHTKRFCTCHGISGACTVQTCYGKLPALAEVSESLYIKYDGAVKVDLIDGKLQRASTFVANPLDVTDLAFSDESPDLCVNASTKGVQGTAHRVCELSDSSTKSCSVLCCGRGHYLVTDRQEKEDCVFHFCCDIICTKKYTESRVYKCNP